MMTDKRALEVVNGVFFHLKEVGKVDAVEKLDVYEHLSRRLADAVDYERKWNELVEVTGRRVRDEAKKV